MEGQRIPSGLRMCSKCRIIKDTCEFHKCGAVSKKTGERYYSSLCRGCHKTIMKESYRRKKQRGGQQIVLRDDPRRPPAAADADCPVLEFPRDGEANLSDASFSE